MLSYFAEGKQFLLSQFFLSRPFFVVYFLALYHSHIQTQLVVQWDWDISCRKRKFDLLLWWKFPYSCILLELVLWFVHQLNIQFCSVCPSSSKEISFSPPLLILPSSPFLLFNTHFALSLCLDDDMVYFSVPALCNLYSIIFVIYNPTCINLSNLQISEGVIFLQDEPLR